MLENSYYKLTHNDSFRIAYFGGSITEGCGASKPCMKWTSKTTAWLSETFPKCKISVIEAAIGGTGSDLGVYRCDRDIIEEKPDLVFYEFAVNDGWAGEVRSFIQTESIFRKIFSADPTCDIVIIFTTTKGVSDGLDAGNIFYSRKGHSSAGDYYGLLQIDVGEVLRAQIRKENADWLRYTQDNVHPNDDGYEIYFETVKKYLSDEFKKCEGTAGLIPKILPAPVTSADELLCGAHMEDCRGAQLGEGWHVKEESFVGRYPRYVESNVPGAELSFRFRGKRIGLYFMLAKDSGTLEFSVDGEEFEKHGTWDHYCKDFNRAGIMMLKESLCDAEHELRVRVVPEKDAESEGYFVRIATFMVS